MAKKVDKLGTKINTAKVKLEVKTNTLDDLIAKLSIKTPIIEPVKEEIKDIPTTHDLEDTEGKNRLMRIIKRSRKSKLIVYIDKDIINYQQIKKITETPFSIMFNNKKIISSNKFNFPIEFSSKMKVLGREYDYSKIEFENLYIQ